MSKIRQALIISDIHAGCQMALCPPSGIHLDNGGIYMPSEFQRGLWKFWNKFHKWVKKVMEGKPYILVVNGDALDGVHHNSTHQISHDLDDQQDLAYKILKPVVDRARKYYHIRGTSAHVGEAGVYEEMLARRLGAIPNDLHQYARHDLWLEIGDSLAHIMHTIGTTGSVAYESTAVHKELVEALNESARYNERPPDAIVRSHRHRYFETKWASAQGRQFSVVTAGWQGKTPFVYKIAGGRNSRPQFGGIILKWNPGEGLYSRALVETIGRSKTE